tara:strand:+ start:15 stop:908 length:894 start_codon:yes stop_codon:yes gene_type:complete
VKQEYIVFIKLSMSTTMNSRSITDYILKLEKENRELQSLCDEQGETIRTVTFNEIDLKKQIRDFKKIRAVLGDVDSYEESRHKIEQLKKLLTEANEEKVDALDELNELKYMMRISPSYTDTTARVTKKSLNQGLVEYLIELGNMTSDFYKTAAYERAAEIIGNLPYEVESGESLLNIKGIGKGIANKIDTYIEEQDSDYAESDVSDEESVASNDDDSFVSETDDEDYFVSYNTGLADMLYECADKAEDNFKRNAYTKAADTIYNLSYKITSGKNAMNLRGIGKSIAKKIDDELKNMS